MGNENGIYRGEKKRIKNWRLMFGKERDDEGERKEFLKRTVADAQ